MEKAKVYKEPLDGFKQQVKSDVELPDEITIILMRQLLMELAHVLGLLAYERKQDNENEVSAPGSPRSKDNNITATNSLQINLKSGES